MDFDKFQITLLYGFDFLEATLSYSGLLFTLLHTENCVRRKHLVVISQIHPRQGQMAQATTLLRPGRHRAQLLIIEGEFNSEQGSRGRATHSRLYWDSMSSDGVR